MWQELLLILYIHWKRGVVQNQEQSLGQWLFTSLTYLIRLDRKFSQQIMSEK